MIKKYLATALVLSISLISMQAYAQRVIKLGPKQSKSLSNNTLWTFSAKCDIQTQRDHEVILVSVKENSGEVNGKKLSKGQSTSVALKAKDHISVSAEPGTVVNIVNMGKDPVEANCYS